jgi:putative endonuclease
LAYNSQHNPETDATMTTTADTQRDNWYIYILRCNDGSLYTGICRNIKRRLHEHNNLKAGARYTRTRRPVELVYVEAVATRSAAARREYRIKRLTSEQKRDLARQQRNMAPFTCDSMGSTD